MSINYRDSRIEREHAVVGKTLAQSRDYDLSGLYPVVDKGRDVITGVVGAADPIADLGYYYDEGKECWYALDTLLDYGNPVRAEDALVYLTQRAYVDNAGSEVVYHAAGVDSKGRKYLITWGVIDACADGDESNACDWDNPVSVELID